MLRALLTRTQWIQSVRAKVQKNVRPLQDIQHSFIQLFYSINIVLSILLFKLQHFIDISLTLFEIVIVYSVKESLMSDGSYFIFSPLFE